MTTFGRPEIYTESNSVTASFSRGWDESPIVWRVDVTGTIDAVALDRIAQRLYAAAAQDTCQDLIYTHSAELHVTWTDNDAWELFNRVQWAMAGILALHPRLVERCAFLAADIDSERIALSARRVRADARHPLAEAQVWNWEQMLKLVDSAHRAYNALPCLALSRWE
jgi:hypothetical protein